MGPRLPCNGVQSCRYGGPSMTQLTKEIWHDLVHKNLRNHGSMIHNGSCRIYIIHSGLAGHPVKPCLIPCCSRSQYIRWFRMKGMDLGLRIVGNTYHVVEYDSDILACSHIATIFKTVLLFLGVPCFRVPTESLYQRLDGERRSLQPLKAPGKPGDP